MPLVIHPRLGRRLSEAAALAAGLLALTSSSAGAATALDTSTCAPPPLTQPFLAWKDKLWYALAPGQQHDDFTAAGWTLSGGASVMSQQLADGTSHQVLDLPSGSKAVSPTMCVTSDYPTARTMVRNVVGGEGVFFYVSYMGTKTWDAPKNTGQVHGKDKSWTLSDPVKVQPGKVAGWQIVRFTFVPGGTTSRFQVYNFYVDPYRS